MTISDTTPHNVPPRASRLHAEPDTSGLFVGVESSVDFTIGPGVTPVEAMERAGAMVELSLPRFLAGVPGAAETCSAVLSVLTELVDLTARYKAGLDLVGRVTWDGHHVIVSVGDMGRPLPAPEEEPGLYLVNRVADDVGQHAGDQGGRVTWASVAA
ncbi:hypothetical protein [Streptomyces anulatus]|uniref:hypothetical protein n=1 Tax=Streptomyces anulatus TaxID=1892 RepID=UPI0037DD13F6|nr:hypothetical protein OHB50_38980 [Streptomyces anulatus]